MKLNEIEPEDLIDKIGEYKWIKYLVYGGATIISIWILGKASKMLTDAVINFKSFHHAIKN